MIVEKANISFKPGIYLHIPFCEHKCGYCDFYSITNRQQQPQFVQALLIEMEKTLQAFSINQTFDTIYFGGGTPSLLEIEQLETILEFLRQHFNLAQDCEITLEMNPGATEREKLPLFKELGINRLSIGVQSFDDQELRFLERIHSARQAIEAFEAARKAGFNNIGLDLIYALPGQTLASWEHSLQQAVDLNPEHISAYNLSYEPNTPFFKRLQKGQITPAAEDNELEFFNFTHQFLTDKGYLHYEVSNFARDEALVSRHNYKYWLHVPYLGFGPSAHSYWTGQRWGNKPSLNHYLQQLNNGQFPQDFHETLNEQTEEFEHIFLRLRTYDGLDFAAFANTFGRSFLKSYRKIVDELMSSELAEIKNNRFCLTQKGMALCDEILQRFV